MRFETEKVKKGYLNPHQAKTSETACLEPSSSSAIASSEPSSSEPASHHASHLFAPNNWSASGTKLERGHETTEETARD